MSSIVSWKQTLFFLSMDWSLESISWMVTRPGKLTVCELENGHRNSEFYHEKWVGFPVRYVKLPEGNHQWIKTLLNIPCLDGRLRGEIAASSHADDLGFGADDLVGLRNPFWVDGL